MKQLSQKIRILIVDDSDIIRNALKNFFQDYNGDVATCHDGLEGLQKAAEFKPNLILLDLMMPNFDGIKMLQALKVLSDLKHIPVIVISANTDKRTLMAAIEAGAEKVILKPLQKDVLTRYINETLGVDFLKNAKMNLTINEEDNKEIQQRLLKMFIDKFPVKQENILNGIKNKDKESLRAIFHDLKGTGSTIGYPNLTKLSGEIETLLDEQIVDWTSINLKCQQIFSIIERIQLN